MLQTEALAYLAGVSSSETKQASEPTNVHMISGEVMTASENGTVEIAMDGVVYSPDDTQYIRIPAIGGLEPGDIATVVLVGESGHGLSPLAIGGVGTVDRIGLRIAAIEADYIKAEVLEVEVARIDALEADHVTVAAFEAEQANIDALQADHVTVAAFEAEQANIDALQADHVTVSDFQAEQANIDALQADHVTVSDFQAEQANIDALQAATADIATIRANSAKVTNLTAAQLEAVEAYISTLVAGNLSAANIIADHATVGSLDTNYAQINLANVDNAWIENGTVKDGAITNAMINSVSANKLTAGTIDASNITVTNLNASNITAGTLNGQRIGTGSLSLDKLSDDVYTETEIDAMLETMQAEIDGAIETWTGTDVPTLNNAPASGWTTNAEKDTHVGDVYFVVNSQSQQNGYNYRFTKTTSGGTSTYSWQLIKDNDVTNALQRITDIETFDSTVSSYMTNTDEELTSIKSAHTTLVGRVDKTIVETIQLWYTKADTTAPSKPTTAVTSTSTSGNAWRVVVPAYNSSYPNYFYCYQWKYADGTYGWSNVTRDIGMGETQSTARSAATAASTADGKAVAAQSTADSKARNFTSQPTPPYSVGDTWTEGSTGDMKVCTTARESGSYTASDWVLASKYTDDTTANAAASAASTADGKAVAAQNTANANIKSSVQLWFTKANTTAPSKPTSQVTTNNASTANAWNLAVPTYNSSYHNYYYCYQQQKGDGTYQWTDVVYDRATTENQANARSALTQVGTKVETSTFNALSQTVDSNSASITTLTTITENNGLTSSTNITNTVNTVSQTASGNSSKISQLASTLGTNADGTTKDGDVVHRTSAIEQDLSGFKTTVSNTYATQTNLNTEINQRKALYVTSDTAAGTAAKAGTCSNFVLYTGARIAVTFSTANTASTPTLNVNSTGAKGIRSHTGAALSEAEYKWAAGTTMDLVYDGTYWRMQDNGVITRMKAAESSITQNADNIELKVSKDGVISSINQSAESVTIDAEKVNIAGAALFTGSGRLSETSLNDAYDANGAASTAESNAKSYADTKKTEAINSANSSTDTKLANYSTTTQMNSAIGDAVNGIQIGGRNLLRKTGNFTLDDVAYSRTTMPEANVLRCTPTTSSAPAKWKVDYLDYAEYGSGTYTFSVEARLANVESSYTNVGCNLYICVNPASRIGSAISSSYDRYGFASFTDVTSAWKKFSLTVEVPDDLTAGKAAALVAGSQLTVEVNALGKTVPLEFRKFKLEKGDKATDWTEAPEDALAQEQMIYISAASGTTSVQGTTTWVTASTDSQNTWTLKRPTYNSSYPVLFVATQSKTVGGTVTCTTPLKDDTTTVIDGGHITTGTIDASVATITNINASNISSGDISADRIKTNVISAINSLTAGQINAARIKASDLTIGESQVTNLTTDLGNKANTSDIPTTVAELTDSGDYLTTSDASSTYATQTNLTTEINQRKATYGTCSTAASTRDKAVTCSDFELVAGNELTVYFSTANTYASNSVRLNVNGKGVKNVWVANTVTSTSNMLLWGAGARITFRYDGTQFIVIGEPRTWYGASTTEAATAAKTDTTAVTGCVICKGATVNLQMTNANSVANPTLNIQSTGAKAIYTEGSQPTADSPINWPAASTVAFVFDGQYWRYDSSALRKANTASKTATTYITHVDDNGITIHPSSTTNNRVAINANGMEIFKNNISVAQYGDDIRIGKLGSGNKNVIVDTNGMAVRDNTTEITRFGANQVDMLSGETSIIGQVEKYIDTESESTPQTQEHRNIQFKNTYLSSDGVGSLLFLDDFEFYPSDAQGNKTGNTYHRGSQIAMRAYRSGGLGYIEVESDDTTGDVINMSSDKLYADIGTFEINGSAGVFSGSANRLGSYLAGGVQIFQGTYASTHASQVVLSQSADNFHRLLLIWQDNDGYYGDAWIDTSLPKTADAAYTGWIVHCVGAQFINSSNVVYLKVKNYIIHGVYIDTARAGTDEWTRSETTMPNNASPTHNRTDVIGIVKVFGFY